MPREHESTPVPDAGWNPFQAPGATTDATDPLVDAYWPRTLPGWIVSYVLAGLSLALAGLGVALLTASVRSASSPSPSRLLVGPGVVALTLAFAFGLLAVLIRRRLLRIEPTVRFYREGIVIRIRLRRPWGRFLGNLRPFPARLAWSDLISAGITGRRGFRRLTLMAARLALDPSRLRDGSAPPVWMIRYDAQQFEVPLPRAAVTIQAYLQFESARRGLSSWDGPPSNRAAPPLSPRPPQFETPTRPSSPGECDQRRNSGPSKNFFLVKHASID